MQIQKYFMTKLNSARSKCSAFSSKFFEIKKSVYVLCMKWKTIWSKCTKKINKTMNKCWCRQVEKEWKKKPFDKSTRLYLNSHLIYLLINSRYLVCEHYVACCTCNTILLEFFIHVLAKIHNFIAPVEQSNAIQLNVLRAVSCTCLRKMSWKINEINIELASIGPNKITQVM